MGLFKNGVGRPSNETIRKRRTVYAIICVAIVGIAAAGAFYVSNIFNNRLLNSKGKNATLTNTVAKSGDVASELKLVGDGKITQEDIYVMQRLIAGEKINGKTKDNLLKSGTKNKLADINGDGKVDANDIDLASIFVINLRNVSKNIVLDANLGDINKNGVFDQEDVELLKQYVHEKDKYLTESQVKLADFNKDGLVNNNDIEELAKYVVKLGTCKNGNTTINATLGDVNCDGKLTKDDQSLILNYSVSMGSPNTMQKKQADINGDGKIGSDDAQIIGTILGSENQYFVGDINKSGKVESKDLNILKNYLNKKRTLNATQLDLADINRDGKVNSTDKNILERIVAGYGDLVNAYNSGGDGKLTLEDYELILANAGTKVSTSSNNLINSINTLVGAFSYLAGGMNYNQKKAADINGDGKITEEDAAQSYNMMNNKFDFTGNTANGLKVSYDKNTQTLTLNGTAKSESILMTLMGQSFKQNEKYKTTLTYVSGSISKTGSPYLVTEVVKKGVDTIRTGSRANTQFPTSKTKTTTATFTVNNDAAKNGKQLRVWISNPKTLKFTNYKIKISIANKNAKVITITFDKNQADSLSFYSTKCVSIDNQGCSINKLPAIYKTGASSTAFYDDKILYSSADGIYQRVFKEDTTLYAKVDRMNHGYKDLPVVVGEKKTILDKPIYFEGSKVNGGRNVSTTVPFNDHYNYLLEVSKHMPYLFFDKGPLYYLINYSNLWGESSDGSTPSPARQYTITYVKTRNTYHEYYSAVAIHELGHTTDEYYRLRTGSRISDLAEVKALYNDCKKMTNKPMRSYSYDNLSEFIADFFTYYYYYKYKPNGKNIPPSYDIGSSFAGNSLDKPEYKEIVSRFEKIVIARLQSLQ